MSAVESSWFGPATFTSVSAALFVNVIPITMFPLVLVVFVFLYVGELVLGIALCVAGGRARQIGTGILVALAAVAVIAGVLETASIRTT
ncbi:MAG: hypothetical protein J2P17_13000 [Mycobacterium sp.]|nr:hypothetical protein [Mycobacterium sp.]